MGILIICVFLMVIILPIGIGYYLDYKRDKKYFISGIKGILSMIFFYLIFFYILKVFNKLIDIIIDLF